SLREMTFIFSFHSLYNPASCASCAFCASVKSAKYFSTISNVVCFSKVCMAKRQSYTPSTLYRRAGIKKQYGYFSAATRYIARAPNKQHTAYPLPSITQGYNDTIIVQKTTATCRHVKAHTRPINILQAAYSTYR